MKDVEDVEDVEDVDVRCPCECPAAQGGQLWQFIVHNLNYILFNIIISLSHF